MLGPRPPELEALIARRQKLGLDKLDEVWEGDYHMNAAAPSGPHAWMDQQLAVLLEPLARPVGLYGSGIFNLGDPDNFRVPDRGLHRSPPIQTWFPTAAMVVEIESPGDETWKKFDFYAAHAVDEILVVSPERRSVEWFALDHPGWSPRDRSELLGPASAALPDQLEWPPAG